MLLVSNIHTNMYPVFKRRQGRAPQSHCTRMRPEENTYFSKTKAERQDSGKRLLHIPQLCSEEPGPTSELSNIFREHLHIVLHFDNFITQKNPMKEKEQAREDISDFRMIILPSTLLEASLWPVRFCSVSAS